MFNILGFLEVEIRTEECEQLVWYSSYGTELSWHIIELVHNCVGKKLS